MPTSTSTPPTGTPSPDALEALRNREPEAVECWIYNNRSFILGVLQRYSKTTEEAQDLLQETFFQALRSLPNFRGGSKMTTWLYSIAKNVALQRGRTNDRYAHMEDDALNRMMSTTHGTAFRAPSPSSPDTATSQSEEESLLYDALDELPDSYREVITLRDLNELSTDEVADKLDITPGNVRVRLHRARKRLRSILQPHVEGAYTWGAA